MKQREKRITVKLHENLKVEVVGHKYDNFVNIRTYTKNVGPPNVGRVEDTYPVFCPKLICQCHILNTQLKKKFTLGQCVQGRSQDLWRGQYYTSSLFSTTVGSCTWASGVQGKCWTFPTVQIGRQETAFPRVFHAALNPVLD